MNTARDLFEYELRSAYDAETRLSESLRSLAKAVKDAKLAEALNQHCDQTERQIQRLVKVFGSIGVGPERERCRAVVGLIADLEAFLDEKPTDPILNLGVATGCRKVEQYEFALYESLVDLASHLGVDDALPPLKEILAEESAAVKQLEGMTGKLLTDLP